MRAIVLALLLCVCARAQVSPYHTVWGQGQKPDFIRSVKQLASGSVYAAGFSAVDGSPYTEGTLHKLNANGQPVWTVYFGDTLSDYGLFLLVTQNNQLLVCGETQTATNGVDAFFCLFDTTGSLLWRKTYGGPQNESAKAVTQTATGNFVATGFMSAGAGTNDVLLLRTDAAGNQLYLTGLGNSDNDYGQAIRALPDSGSLLVADSRDPSSGDYDVLVIRLDKNDNVAWSNTFGDTHDNGSQSLTLLSDGTFIVCGETHTAASSSSFDFSLEKIGMNGVSQWRSVFGGTGSDAAFGVLEVYGGYLLCGYSNSGFSGPVSGVLARTDTAGNMLWMRTVRDTGISILYEIIPSVNNLFLTAGNTNTGLDDQCLLLCADAAGWTNVLQLPQPHIIAYPNPGHADFPVLHTTNIPEYTLAEIFAADGRLVCTAPVSGGKLLVNTPLLPGVYLVKWTEESGAVKCFRWVLE
ncbi:MAG: T9SS type A sorting domain-containing protein [Bacteroidetes bacterium]|nr:T9SS type A sorting domain-containing protein [Bacteroidota bacterium]